MDAVLMMEPVRRTLAGCQSVEKSPSSLILCRIRYGSCFLFIRLELRQDKGSINENHRNIYRLFQGISVMFRHPARLIIRRVTCFEYS